VKKCSRCNAILKWEKSYCPICGGHTADAPDIAPEQEQQTVQAPPHVPVAPIETSSGGTQMDSNGKAEPATSEFLRMFPNARPD
jgi:hypothetical protein